jgi:hypothetical protein
MPYILPPMSSYRLLGAERDRGGGKGGNPFEEGPEEEAGASSSGEDEDNSGSEEDHGESPSSSSSTRRDSTSSSSSSCTPLSIAVTDFHYLVLARVRSWGAESKSKLQAGGKGPGPRAAGRREKERGRGRGGRRSEGRLGHYLLAMSRLDGALSQSIDLTSQMLSSSIVRFKVATHPHTTQHTPHQPVRSTDSKKKSSVDPSPPVPALREEGLEGTPLGLFSDPKTGSVWLYSDKALYQVLTACLCLCAVPDTPLLVRSAHYTLQTKSLPSDLPLISLCDCT